MSVAAPDGYLMHLLRTLGVTDDIGNGIGNVNNIDDCELPNASAAPEIMNGSAIANVPSIISTFIIFPRELSSPL
jgi:hypothetical protein